MTLRGKKREGERKGKREGNVRVSAVEYEVTLTLNEERVLQFINLHITRPFNKHMMSSHDDEGIAEIERNDNSEGQRNTLEINFKN